MNDIFQLMYLKDIISSIWAFLIVGSFVYILIFDENIILKNILEYLLIIGLIILIISPSKKTIDYKIKIEKSYPCIEKCIQGKK